MDEIVLVHLSDTHLGRDYVMRSLWRKRLFWKTEDEKLLHNLENALRKVEPHYIIHIGDVVNKAIPHNFRKTAQRLRTVFGNAGIDIKKRVLVIPGNHDVKVLASEDQSAPPVKTNPGFSWSALEMWFHVPLSSNRTGTIGYITRFSRRVFLCSSFPLTSIFSGKTRIRILQRRLL